MSNCARPDCGHAKSLHDEEAEGGGRCWGCHCPAYTEAPDAQEAPKPAASVEDFDTSDGSGNPGL